jgi:hypothetical protein
MYSGLVFLLVGGCHMDKCLFGCTLLLTVGTLFLSGCAPSKTNGSNNETQQLSIVDQELSVVQKDHRTFEVFLPTDGFSIKNPRLISSASGQDIISFGIAGNQAIEPMYFITEGPKATNPIKLETWKTIHGIPVYRSDISKNATLYMLDDKNTRLSIQVIGNKTELSDKIVADLISANYT